MWLAKYINFLNLSVKTTELKIGYGLVIPTILQPVMFILLDLGSDGKVLVDMKSYAFPSSTSSYGPPTTNETDMEFNNELWHANMALYNVTYPNDSSRQDTQHIGFFDNGLSQKSLKLNKI